jgi:O-antigen ligase
MLGHQGNAHNSYITFWLDTGIFGVLAYVVGIISAAVKGLRRSVFGMPVLYAVLFSSFFESWLTASLNPFTIQLLLIITILTKEEISLVPTVETETPKPELPDETKAAYPVH